MPRLDQVGDYRLEDDRFGEADEAEQERKAVAALEVMRTAQPVLDAIKAAQATDEGLSDEVVAQILATLAHEFSVTPCGSSTWNGQLAIDHLNKAESALDDLAEELAKGDRE